MVLAEILLKQGRLDHLQFKEEAEGQMCLMVVDQDADDDREEAETGNNYLGMGDAHSHFHGAIIMIHFKQFINEKLTAVNNDDLEMIIEPLRPILEELRNNLRADEDKRLSLKVKYQRADSLKTFSSAELESELAKQAHINNPIRIQVGVGIPNEYNPLKSEIQIGITRGAISAYPTWETLDKSLKNRYLQEFEPARIKAAIRHELTHWIDDSLHDRHLKKTIQRAALAGGEKGKTIKTRGESDIHLTDYEINAVINGIAQIKYENRKRWNEMTWEELKNRYPTLGNLDRELGSEWRRKVFTRMGREGLIGDNMKP